MKPVIFTGVHNSGKTTIILRALKGLTKKGNTVEIIKHAENFTVSSNLKDTELFSKNGAVQSIAILSDKIISFTKRTSIKNCEITDKELLQFLILSSTSDFILIEGFKNSMLPIPKIVVCKDETNNFKLFDELTVGYIAKERYKEIEKHFPAAHHINPDVNENQLASFIEKNTFDFLGGLDCGECGYQDCLGLARAIIEGKETTKSCRSLTSNVELYIDNTKIPMKDFVRSILKGTVEGFIKNLHGWKKGEITLKIK